MILEGTQFTYTGFITICGLLGVFLGYFFLPYDLKTLLTLMPPEEVAADTRT